MAAASVVADPITTPFVLAVAVILAVGTDPATVIVAVLLEVLPLLSVTVNVTVFVPMLEQLKEVFDNVIDLIPQASEEPLSTSDVEMLATPFTSVIDLFLTSTVGGVMSVTVTV